MLNANEKKAKIVWLLLKFSIKTESGGTLENLIYECRRCKVSPTESLRPKDREGFRHIVSAPYPELLFFSSFFLFPEKFSGEIKEESLCRHYLESFKR